MRYVPMIFLIIPERLSSLVERYEFKQFLMSSRFSIKAIRSAEVQRRTGGDDSPEYRKLEQAGIINPLAVFVSTPMVKNLNKKLLLEGRGGRSGLCGLNTRADQAHQIHRFYTKDE